MERKSGVLSLAIGEKAPYFSLPATDGKIYSLSDFVDKRALVVIFTCNHCPYAQAYEERICQLVKRYSPKDVSFVAICSNDSDGYPEDGFEQMVEKSKSLGFLFPYLHDEKQIVAKAYDAACTPEVYLFDNELKLAYHGRIDDDYRNPETAKNKDLAEAIEAVLAGQEPKNKLTSVIGCSIKWKP